MDKDANLTPHQTGQIADCHRNTVINYERKGIQHGRRAEGIIKSMRDANNFRRFPLSEALKLKKILETRKPSE